MLEPVEITIMTRSILGIGELGNWRGIGGELGENWGRIGGNWLGELDKLGEVKPMSDLKS